MWVDRDRKKTVKTGFTRNKFIIDKGINIWKGKV